jgi:hypothetical protein
VCFVGHGWAVRRGRLRVTRGDERGEGAAGEGDCASGQAYPQGRADATGEGGPCSVGNKKQRKACRKQRSQRQNGSRSTPRRQRKAARTYVAAGGSYLSYVAKTQGAAAGLREAHDVTNDMIQGIADAGTASKGDLPGVTACWWVCVGVSQSGTVVLGIGSPGASAVWGAPSNPQVTTCLFGVCMAGDGEFDVGFGFGLEGWSVTWDTGGP